MGNSNAFTYTYSSVQNREVERIRKKYLPKEESKIEILRKLDSRVQSAGVIPSLCLGVVGCLIFDIGMCFGLDVFAGADWLSVLFGALGIVIMLPAYLLYKRISGKTRAELAPEILRLSDEIMKQL